MTGTPFGLLELGSNSLKFYLVAGRGESGARITTYKASWRVAHEFFRHGSIGEAAAEEIIRSLRAVEAHAAGLPLSGMLAVATGVFREIENMDDVAARVKQETGVRIRVISGADEAKLMARDFTRHTAGRSVFLFDLGGATTEWAWFDRGEPRQCGSLRLGAIRNEYALRPYRENRAAYLTESAQRCDEQLASLPFREPVDVVATGGTAKAAARHLGSDTVTCAAVRDLIDQVLEHGPPGTLKPARSAVFLPGLIILWRILERCRAPYLTYGKASVRDGMAGRLLRLLEKHERQDLHATLLLNTSMLRKKRRDGEKR
jgi:exopolyphosphatase/guanosine-5'-triphosphate,3'-diphosphate pyrophosphatase